LRRRRFPLLVTLPALPALSACGISLRQPASTSPEPDAPRIDARAAHEAIAAGRAILIDVRGESGFLARRAAGAVLITLDEIERAPADAARRIPGGKQPILYCT
jgi:hypothetical protein